MPSIYEKTKKSIYDEEELIPFDPEGAGYDMESALKYGMKPQIGDDGKPHWQSRVPQTGLLLKGRKHETWNLLEKGEREAGYEIYKKDGRYYSSKPKTIYSQPLPPEELELPGPQFRPTPREAIGPDKGVPAIIEKMGLPEIGKAMREMVAPTMPYTEEEADRAAHELGKRIVLIGKSIGTLGGRIGPKGFREKLSQEIEDLGGFGPALVPMAGETGALAIEWGFIYPKLFKLAGLSGKAISKIPKVGKGIRALKSMGGIAKVAEKHPRIYSAATKAMAAFAKGEFVGQTMAAVESLGKDKPIEEWIVDMNKRGALMGGVATAFSLAHSVDQHRYITQTGRYLRLNAYNRHVERVNKGMLPRHSAEMSRHEGKKIDDVIYYLEQQMLGAPAELYGGKKPELSPQEAAKALAKQGYVLGESGKTAKQLSQIRKPYKPRDVLLRPEPTTKGTVYTAPKNTYREAYNPNTGQRYIIPEGLKVELPKGFEVSEPISLRPTPAAQLLPPIRTTEEMATFEQELAQTTPEEMAQQIPDDAFEAEVAEMDVELREIQRPAAEVAEKPPKPPPEAVSPEKPAVAKPEAAKAPTEPELTKKELRQREIEAETEEAGISPQRRNRLIKETETRIGESDVYQAEVAGLETAGREIDVGFYYVPEKFRTEVEDIIGKRKGFPTKIQKMFTFDPRENALDWTKVVQEGLGRGKTGIDEAPGAMDITEFVQRVKDVEAKQRLAEEVARKGRKAKARLDPKQAALIKAKTVARKLKAPAYIYEKQGRFFVSKNPPTKGAYTKVSPPTTGEITQKITKEVRTQKDQAIAQAKAVAKKANTDYFVWQNPQGRFIATKKEPLVGDYTRVNPQGETSLVRGPEQATDEQKSRVNELAKQKGLLNEKGKPTPRYRKFARVVTGKTTIEAMTKEEAEELADMLDLLTVDYRGIARIPSPMDIINKELLTELKTKVPELKTIGFLERFRPAWRVFRKMGLYHEVFDRAFEAEISSVEELFDFRKQAKEMQKLVAKDKITAEKLFNALENPGSVKLSDNEKTVVGWAKKFFDDWADRLNLPIEARRKNYITHIFEKDIAEQLKEKHPIDPDLIRALDFITPQTIFNPFLQKRLGKTTGLQRDLWAAMQAYEGRAIKKFYYEPLIKRIRVYEKFLPPNSARYLRNYITRITSRPLVIDKEINQTLKEAAEQISKLPGGKKMAQYLTKGNASGLLAYNITGIYYEAWLGLRPASAIKNLSQHGLALAETGPAAFFRAMKTIGKERARLLANSKVLRSRQSGYLPGIDQTFIKGLESKRRKIEMFMFRAADRKNVSDAFLAGYHEAKAKGLSDEWAYKRGDEVAQKTQYLYTKLSGAQASQSGIGRVLSVLTTWPENWAELMKDWIQAKPSQVYQDYAKETGQKVTPTNWATRRKSLWTYLSLVGTAKLVEKGTPIKAMYYTGWTSIKSIKDIASGKLPGLELPATIALLVAGLTLGDKKLLKQAWNRIQRFWVIQKELRDIISGKKDWLNLFIYLEKKKDKESGTE